MKSIRNFFTYLLTSIILFALIYGINFLVKISLKATRIGYLDFGLLTLHRVPNKGAAFNLLSGNIELIIALSIIALFAIIFYVVYNARKINQLTISALSLLTSGIGMNLYERITSRCVIDYIDLRFIPNMPVFNMADVFIVAGTICLVVALLRNK